VVKQKKQKKDTHEIKSRLKAFPGEILLRRMEIYVFGPIRPKAGGFSAKKRLFRVLGNRNPCPTYPGKRKNRTKR